MAKNEYKGADRWTTDGRGVVIAPLTAAKKKQIEALNKELAAPPAQKKKPGGAKKGK